MKRLVLFGGKSMPHPWDSKWDVGRRLGKGGQGITYEVMNKENAQLRGALKYLKNNEDIKARGRMRREVANLEALASLGGFVPRVLDHNTGDFERQGVELYMVMDLIAGTTMADFVSVHGPLPLDTVVPMILSLCKTVELAHSFPILHRDLKPENIIVRHDDVTDLVIVDYGLSFNPSAEPITEMNETFRNRFLDLPETNTPSGDRRDHRSDLTALCALLYFCVTKHVVGHLHDGTGMLPHFRPGYSVRDVLADDARCSHVEAFLTRGLSPNVANRFQAVCEIVDSLSPLATMSRDMDESDPFQLAAALSDQIRAVDRKTQIAEFAGPANVLFGFLQKECGKYQKKLGRFTLKLQVGGAMPKVTLPEGLELVTSWQTSLVLKTVHHPRQVTRRFLVASRGEECVLLAVDCATSADSRKHEGGVLSISEEVGWYRGDPESIYPLVATSCRRWVTEKLKVLAGEIIATGDTNSPRPFVGTGVE